jgi:hypothetical protein
MDAAIKVDFNGRREPITTRELQYMRTLAMSFRCVYCDKRVLLYRRLNRPDEFVHNVRNKDCPYSRCKRGKATARDARRRR